ncbi:ADP-ribosyl-[dinitrogen reductase] hydrolase [Cereibacter sphaeroides]|uniref:ADP-ribosyl-[dinitrogen reductase] hydrolase n=1 Tax=Cereibacter sphaeroides TaxID=1063 RepID=UPI001F44ABEE|nr:ADP-ribosyl-[dinitrogen reductase] hydrolase [Cereibacter sphaeroides]MCE6959162.1 ADP-ribosyl-[dinitrogen reductase] hydrolase [Cereibacter sphaeroides]MCE6968403.1 ADP-ribosyl-[dinitrogen reductase] hydrolase [Cereibacter sphaeroides]MCE6974177.1 ADP-ribosyl-[dinitrogen reductase] hydrolase [Cereibacter sphaeroides]
MSDVGSPGLEDRALAAYLGLAVGDALGATVEFMTRSEIAARHGVHREIVGGGWLKLRPGQVTDDTEMSLALGRSLIRKGGLDARDLCEEFAGWLKSGPVDVGNTCRRGIRRFLVHGTVEGTYSDGDAGNGAAMRVLPVALATLGDPGRAEAWTLAQARATHHHPLSDDACLALVRMTQGLLHGQGKDAVRRVAEDLAARHRVFRLGPGPGQSSAYIVDTMQTVLHHYLGAESFDDCLVGTVNQGGDADTTGALAGMLAGATYGLGGIPARWLAALDPDVAGAIRAQVPRLLALSAGAAG